MYKLIGADGKEYGPVSAEQLRQWIAEGRANAQTQVRAEGATDWAPAGQVAEFADLFAAPPPPVAGVAAPPLPPRAPATLDIGSCISRSWNLLQKNFGLIVGATFLIVFILAAVGMALRWGTTLVMGVSIQDMMQARGLDRLRLEWPGIAANSVWSMVMGGPLWGGLYVLYLKLIRGQPASLGDAFSGFGPQFLQLMLANIVAPFLVMAGLFFCLIPGVYLAIIWRFALPCVIDKKLGFWEAMELSRKGVSGRWWPVFALTLLCGLVGAAGILVCCVGVFVTAPIAIGAILYAYEDLLGIQFPAS